MSTRPEPPPQPRIVAEPGERSAELWPSVGEYPVYDAFIYHVMSHDEVRNARYREALAAPAHGRVVVDIGTGQDLLWARAAVEAGARRVYAIESLDHAAERAAELSKELGLVDRIDVIAGLSQEITLPEPADVCVIEMVGSLGSAEGIANVARDARERLLRPGGSVIPARVVTSVCGVTLPDDLASDPGFTLDAADYVERIWESIGAPADVRLSVRGVEHGHVLTTAAPVEDLDLAGGRTALPADVTATLEVERPGRLDGFLLWTSVWTLPEGEPVETFPTTGSGLPAFVPVFHPGREVAPGTVVTVAFSRRPGPDGLHPDYRLEATLSHHPGGGGSAGTSAACVKLPHRGGPLAQNPFYAALWSL